MQASEWSFYILKKTKTKTKPKFKAQMLGKFMSAGAKFPSAKTTRWVYSVPSGSYYDSRTVPDGTECFVEALTRPPPGKS